MLKNSSRNSKSTEKISFGLNFIWNWIEQSNRRDCEFLIKNFKYLKGISIPFLLIEIVV